MIEAERQLKALEPKLELCRYMIELAIPRKISSEKVVRAGVSHMLELHPGSIPLAWEQMAREVLSSVFSCADVARRKGLTTYEPLPKEVLRLRKTIAKHYGFPVPIRRKRPKGNVSEKKLRRQIESGAKWWANYRTYLNSAQWKTRRALLINERGSQCDNCGKVGLVQVHHLSYERLGRELPIDLQLLCLSCHKQVHGLH